MPCADWSKKKKKNNIEHIKIHIIGVPDDVFDEIIVKSFQNLKKETDIQMQKKQRVPNKMNSDRHTPRYIIIKMANVKERILMIARGKQSREYTIYNNIQYNIQYTREYL